MDGSAFVRFFSWALFSPLFPVCRTEAVYSEEQLPVPTGLADRGSLKHCAAKVGGVGVLDRSSEEK